MAASPRKFSEKIALHNQKQAEETAAFESIMREVGETTRVALDRQRGSQNQLQVLGTFRGGSLPDVNHTIDLQTALSNLHDMKQGKPILVDRIHREKNRQLMGPRSPFPVSNRRVSLTNSQMNNSPYEAMSYLSPPDMSWRRTHSDSALHTSAMIQQNIRPSPNNVQMKKMGSGGDVNDGGGGAYVDNPWEAKPSVAMSSWSTYCKPSLQGLYSPVHNGIHNQQFTTGVYHHAGPPLSPGQSMAPVISLDTSGSLPDLSSFHVSPLESDGRHSPYSVGHLCDGNDLMNSMQTAHPHHSPNAQQHQSRIGPVRPSQQSPSSRRRVSPLGSPSQRRHKAQTDPSDGSSAMILPVSDQFLPHNYDVSPVATTQCPGGLYSPVESGGESPQYSPLPSNGSLFDNMYPAFLQGQLQTIQLQQKFEQIKMTNESMQPEVMGSSNSSFAPLCSNYSTTFGNYVGQQQSSVPMSSQRREMIDLEEFKQSQQKYAYFNSQAMDAHLQGASSGIPDIVLIDADEKKQDLRDLDSGMYDSDLFPSAEALKSSLDPLDLESLQLLSSDPSMSVVTDQATEEEFRQSFL